MLSLIVAASTNNAIGKNNQLLWHLPNDLKFFKNVTWGMPVIMGRKTYESIGKPLPGRINIVITRKQDWQPEGVIVATTMEAALQKAKETHCKEIFIAGGGEIFNQAFSMAHKIYMTRVHAVVDGDVFFPSIDDNNWKLISNEDFSEDKKHAYRYSFQQWVKK